MTGKLCKSLCRLLQINLNEEISSASKPMRLVCDRFTAKICKSGEIAMQIVNEKQAPKEKKHRHDEGRYYKSVPIHAADQVHEEAFNLVSGYVKSGEKVLDLGAGSGAFSLRLHDGGYAVVAADLDTSSWGVAEVHALEVDLNTSFSERELVEYVGCDAVTSIEIIEHAENPSAFLREIKKLLRPNGILVLTTPNVVNLESRRLLMWRGEFELFGREQVYRTGHISILPYWLLEELLLKEGFEILERRFFGKNCRVGWKKVVINLFHSVFLLPLGIKIPFDAAFPVCVGFVCRAKSAVPN
jgi:2-polyprenyl-3-methyl-5-hydroxy-6-metoxy-1,4-benzoquinol methylase